MNLLEKTIAQIGGLDQAAMQGAQARLNDLTKPLGSLGILEELVVKVAGITGNPRPRIGDKVIIIMAGDHGVVEENVTGYPQEVTPQMVLNFVQGGAAINVMARHVGARIQCVDVGVAATMDNSGVTVKKVSCGTKNMAKGPAMTREEAIRSVEAGIQVAEEQIAKGATIIATGDMGIGNTTASSAILAVLSGMPMDCIVGRGTGIDDAMIRHKKEIVRRAVTLNNPDPRDGIDVLAKVGGLEIGGIAGVILGAAASQVPVIVDGFISGAGALIAGKIAPQSLPFMIASHDSVEPGHRIMLKMLGIEPMLQMKMRLGEGTGAALVIGLVEVACKVINEMATFSEAGVSEQVK